MVEFTAVPSSYFAILQLRAYGVVVARFLHTEEVTGSIPVTPTM